MSQQITCEHCHQEHDLTTLLQERSIRPKLLEVGLQCTCGIWTHSYFTNDALKAKVTRVAGIAEEFHAKRTDAMWRRYKVAQDAYKREFEAFNYRWRRKLGMLE